MFAMCRRETNRHTLCVFTAKEKNTRFLELTVALAVNVMSAWLRVMMTSRDMHGIKTEKRLYFFMTTSAEVDRCT